MLPVATECSMVATIRQKPTSVSSARIARWPSMTSVWTSGSGPSSRTEPTSTNFLSCVTSACMIPPVSTPLSTAALIEPCLADRVEGADVVLVAVLDAAAHGPGRRRGEVP